MKTVTTIIVLTFLTLGCNNPPQDKLETEQPDKLTPDSNTQAEESLVYNSGYAIWEYQFDTIIRDFRPVKLKQPAIETLTPQGLEEIVNKTWPKIQIKYLKTSGDTVYLSIPNSEFLTQQMGTAGADQFMISTTYSFTELTGINYVSFSFQEGDHAGPGVYSRNSWNNE